MIELDSSEDAILSSLGAIGMHLILETKDPQMEEMIEFLKEWLDSDPKLFMRLAVKLYAYASTKTRGAIS